MKNEKMQCFFVLNPQSAFYETAFFKQFLALLASQGDSLGIRLKQSRKYLILVKEEMSTLTMVKEFLAGLAERLTLQPQASDV